MVADCAVALVDRFTLTFPHPALSDPDVANGFKLWLNSTVLNDGAA
jgi:hypothetical protein